VLLNASGTVPMPSAGEKRRKWKEYDVGSPKTPRRRDENSPHRETTTGETKKPDGEPQ